MRLREIFLGTCVILATLLGVYALYRLTELLVVMFVAIIFASTVRPILATMKRYHVPGWLSILVIYVVTGLSLIILLTIAIPPVVGLTMEVFQDNAVISKLNYSLMRGGLALQRQFEVYIPVMTLPTRFREFTQLADQTLKEQAWPMASNVAYVLGQILLAIVISIYWLTARVTALRALLRITPRPHQQAIYKLWIETEDLLGGYFRGQLILVLIIGLASFVGLIMLRVPNALPLAVISGLLEFVPFVGPFLAVIPAILMGLTVSPLTAVLIGLWYLVVQQLEGSYLVPKIMSRSMSLHPLIVLLAIYAGFQLDGIVGALLAVPIVGVIQVLIRHAPTSFAEEAAARKSTHSEPPAGEQAANTPVEDSSAENGSPAVVALTGDSLDARHTGDSDLSDGIVPAA